MNLTDAAHMARLLRDAERRGIRRHLRFNNEIKTRQHLATYIKKSKKVRNEDELIAELAPGAELPEHITYEDVPDPPHATHFDAAVSVLTHPNAAGRVSPWLRVPSREVSPNGSRVATPRSSPSHRSSFSSFDMGQMDLPSSEIVESAHESQEDLTEDEELLEEVVEVVDELLEDRCSAESNRAGFYAVVDGLLAPIPGAGVSATSTHAYLSVTPTLMKHQTFPPRRENQSSQKETSTSRTRHPSADLNAEPTYRSEAARYLGTSLCACMCLGQSYENGPGSSSMRRMADASIMEAKESLHAMLSTRDGDFLGSISSLVAVLEAHGQLEFAKLCLRDARDIAKGLLHEPHAVIDCISYMLAVEDRSSHTSPEHGSDRLRDIQAGVEQYFGLLSRSALTVNYQVGWALAHERKFDEAGDVLGLLRARCETVFGPYHMNTAMAGLTLARVYFHKDRPDAAERLVSEMIGRLEQIFDRRHPFRLEVQHRQATFLKKLGKRRSAEAVLREVVGERYAVLGPANPRSISSFQDLQKLLMEENRLDEAERLWHEMSSQARNRITEDPTWAFVAA